MPEIASLLSLKGQVAIITGGSRGIGAAIGEVFGAAGACLTLVARDPARLAATAEKLRTEGYPVLELAADVADEGQVNAVIQKTVEEYGRVDILVNNAGILQAGPITSFSADEWDRMIAVNLTGVFHLCKAVAPLMSAQRSGRIINLASITAQTGGVSGGLHYAAAKGGVISLTKTLARDLGPFNITVNVIRPGQIETDMGALTGEARERVESMIPIGRLGKPEDVAYAALFLASPAAGYITGATIDVNGGILKR
jgi:NAD(P)-dependent dehydrogenase (short-subunit alcohol dehydrogenase family)